MASSYVDPSARNDEDRQNGAYSAGWLGARSDQSGGSRRGHPSQGFVPNDALGVPTERTVRAPADADAIEWGTSGGPCFACMFVKKKDEMNDPFNGNEVMDAYDEMMQLIQDNYSKISNPELVKLVHGFYEREIRTMGYDEWTSTSIARHILFHTNDENTMMQEVTEILYSQIQSLRSRTYCENVLDGTLEPHHKNISLLDRLTKRLGDHLMQREKKKI